MVRRVGVLLSGILGLMVGMAGVAKGDGLIVVRDPGFVVRGHFSFAPLEVRYHKVNCDIRDQVATTSVDQEFYNPNGTRLEGDYIFPVPTDARIDKFAMDIDGKTVEAELLPADKARGVYEDIVRKMKDPALLEYAGRAMFRVHVFPIEPNGTKRITLKYTEMLKQENGLLDYHYTLNTEKYSSRALKNLSIKINVSATDPITSLYSPTHEVEIKREGEKSAVVGYEAKDVRPDTDFHLFIGRKSSDVGVTVLTYRPDPSKEGYFVLLAAPTVKQAGAGMPKDVVFVMDTSGSMAGKKIEQARAALKFCVDTLNEKDRFDVVRFSTEAEPLFNGLQDASAENRKKADDFAGTLKASGGTAIDEALKAALEERKGSEGGRMFMLVFMTDGEPTVGESDPETIVKHVKESPAGANVRVFSFGVGNDVNTKLLDQMAEATRGYSQYVLPEENLEVAMSNFWGKVQDPVMTGLAVESGNGIKLEKMYPHALPDLFKGDQLVAFGTYTGSGKSGVTLTGSVNGEKRTFAEDVTFAEKTGEENDWVAKLWATRRIGYLLDEMRQHGGENAEVKGEIVELARRWGVVTPYTAMLIIEDEKRRNVPVAVQSLREMSLDESAVNSVSTGSNSVMQHAATGGQAVKDSLNTSSYRAAGSLSAASSAAEQSDSRFRFEGQAGGALDRPVTAGPVSEDLAKRMNFGSSTDNGWQNAGGSGGGGAHGYRAVSNYAQQTRVVNHRSFFLNGNQWTDTSVQENGSAKRVKIAFNSDAYFDLLKAHPETAQYLALGSNVTMAVGEVVYDVVEEGTK